MEFEEDDEFRPRHPHDEEQKELHMRESKQRASDAAEEQKFQKKKRMVLLAVGGLVILVLAGVAWLLIAKNSEPYVALGLPSYPSQVQNNSGPVPAPGAQNINVHVQQPASPSGDFHQQAKEIVPDTLARRPTFVGTQSATGTFENQPGPQAIEAQSTRLPANAMLEQLQSLHTQINVIGERLEGFCGAPGGGIKKDPALTKTLQSMTDDLQALAKENQRLKEFQGDAQITKVENEKLKKAQEDLQAALRSTENQVDRLTQENNRLKNSSDRKDSNKKEKESKETKEKKEAKKQDQDRVDDRIAKWAVIGLAANRVVIQDEDGGMHPVEEGSTLKGVKIQKVDLISGDVKTSAGTISYSKK